MSQIATDAILFFLYIHHTLLSPQAPSAVKKKIITACFLNVCREISKDLQQLRLWGRQMAPSSCSRARKFVHESSARSQLKASYIDAVLLR